MFIDILAFLGIICIAFSVGKVVSKLKLPAILGWLITGVVFGPYLVGLISLDVMNSTWYKVVIKFLECFAGVMIGREIVFKKLASSGKQIIGITVIQSIGTYLIVSLFFIIALTIVDLPWFLGFIFGGVALATAPAPALSIVNEYKTNGPVTQTLIPLAAIDDVIGVVMFFLTISFIGTFYGGGEALPISEVIGMVLLPFLIGVIISLVIGLIMRKVNNHIALFVIFICGLLISTLIGIVLDYYLFKVMSINYLLMGMAYSCVIANMLEEEKIKSVMKMYNIPLSISLLVVIVNLGMPLDYKLIAGAGVFTAIYIISRAIGKTLSAYIGGKVTKAPDTVTKYLGFTLLPHSGVSLVFTGVAVNVLSQIDVAYAEVVSGTIVAAAIINEIIAVILAKIAFKKAGEIEENKSLVV